MALIDPNDEDWTSMDDSLVCHAADSGIRQAIDERHRRGLNKPADDAYRATLTPAPQD